MFAEELVRIGHRRPDVVAITAAMLHPTGLNEFAKVFPDRTFDVGIAEQHAVTSAAGLAMGGMHPVVGLYATFLNRAFDQLLLDVALHKCGVTFVLDRAGVTGDDGASHNGMWDMSIVQVVPGLRLAAPRDGTRLVELLNEAIARRATPRPWCASPRARCSRTSTRSTVGGLDVLHPHRARTCCWSASVRWPPPRWTWRSGCRRRAFGVTVVDPRWVKPVDPKLIELAPQFKLVVTIEDNGRAGGCGAMIAQALRDAGVGTPLRDFGIPQQFLEHAKRAAVLQQIGLTGQADGPGRHRDDRAAGRGDRRARDRSPRRSLSRRPDVGRHAAPARRRAAAPGPYAALAVPAVVRPGRGGVGGGLALHQSTTQAEQPSTAAPKTPDIDLVARAAAVDKVLKRRAQAVLKDDQAAFLADVDPANQALVARQRTLFTNLQQFGFAKLAYEQLSQQYDDAVDSTSTARRRTSWPSR